MNADDHDEWEAALDAVKALMPLMPSSHARLARRELLAESAMWYATVLGWRVFPLAVGGKTPLTRRGFKDASSDPVVVRTWWAMNPQANIGTPTGELFDAIDIDAPDGYTTWEYVIARQRATDIAMPPFIGIAHTGGGGRHLLIPPQGGNGAGWGRGLDYRGRGGYIVLPPSLLDHGGRYSWLKAPSMSS